MLRRMAGAALRIAALAGMVAVAGGVVAGEQLPQPLDLQTALQAVPEGLPDEILAAEYQETAIRARAFECRAQDRISSDSGWASGGCGYWHLLVPGQQSRLRAMRRFLDVVEADVAAARDEEAMAVAYVELDRGRNRRDLGQYSNLDVAELDQHYQDIRRARYASQAAQRVTRSLLAIALGRPEELASEVSAPAFPEPFPVLEDVENLMQEATEHNLVLAAWRRRAETDPSAAPLFHQLELNLREGVLELWLGYSVLRTELDAAASREVHRDLRLERSRTLYELEVKADLGDAMTEQTAARLARIQAEHWLAMTLATLNALQSRSLLTVTEGPGS